MGFYDISELKKIKELDVERAMRQFISYQMYFDELDKFVEQSRLYLSNYTPTVVIYDSDTNKSFFADLEKVQDTLISLGMIRPASNLYNLIESVKNQKVDAMSDHLLSFHSEMSILAQKIMAARTADVEPQRVEKPLILAVDDKPELLATIVSMLSDYFKVMALTNIGTVLKAIEKHTPAIFLLDIEMPQMNGYELAALIRKRERFARTPIIFLTAKGSREDVINAVKHGGSDYIVKPVEKNLLVEKLMRYLY